MGRFGWYVIDADGHGGEPVGWRRRVPDRFQAQVVEYVRQIKQHYSRAAAAVPGAGMQIGEQNPAPTTWADDDFEVNAPSSMRQGMYDPAPRIDRRSGRDPEFEQKLKRFMRQSEERQVDFKRSVENKRK